MSDNSDRLERDVEEVLSNIEDFDWRQRHARRPGPIRLAIQRFGAGVVNRVTSLSPNHLLLLGAAMLVVGLVLRGGGLWVAIAGIVIFLIGLFWTSRGGNPQANQPKGGYWRDRYVSYEQPRMNPLRRLFRRDR